MTPEPAIPLVLRLLDHQVVGPEEQLLGNVDDVVVRASGADLLVVGFLSGPGALAMRQGGRTGRALYAVWCRLRPEEHPEPLAVPLDHVTHLDSAVNVDGAASAALASAQGLELWLREHVVAHLPGAPRADAQDAKDTEDVNSADRQGGSGGATPWRRQDSDRTLSRMLELEARTEDGDVLGHVIEVIAEQQDGGGVATGTMRVVEVICSRRHLGQELGYTVEPQGPAILRRLLRWWHDSDRRIAIEDVVAIDWDDGHLVVRKDAVLRHPHDVDRES